MDGETQVFLASAALGVGSFVLVVALGTHHELQEKKRRGRRERQEADGEYPVQQHDDE